MTGSRACFVTGGPPYRISCGRCRSAVAAPPAAPTTSTDFETCLQILVLTDELEAGLQGDGLKQRSEVLGKVGLRIGSQTGRAEVGLNRLSRGCRDRKSHAQFATKLQAEVDILAQERGREGRGPVEVHQGGRLVAREYRAQDRVVQETQEGMPGDTRTLGQDSHLGKVLDEHAQEDVVGDLADAC